MSWTLVKGSLVFGWKAAVARVYHRARPGMLTVLLTSPRVAPGLLTGDAWSALRAASRVLVGSGEHPQIPALTAAGVIPEIVDIPADVQALAAFLSVTATEGSVVWLAPPGESADALPLREVALPSRVLNGSHDLPGAHLLDLVSIMDKLRTSCLWDREQTHASLLPYLLEEAYEAAETIEDGDLEALREEIGDVMFQAFFHARIASERSSADGGFTIDDVADTLAAKLIRRHPHVFGSVSVSSAADVNANWEEIKKAERAAKAPSAGGSAVPSALDGVPFGQPALSLASQLLRRAGRAGFSSSFGNAVDDGISSAEELGDELMRVVARAQATGIDPEMELRAAARGYAERVRAWEQTRQ